MNQCEVVHAVVQLYIAVTELARLGTTREKYNGQCKPTEHTGLGAAYGLLLRDHNRYAHSFAGDAVRARSIVKQKASG